MTAITAQKHGIIVRDGMCLICGAKQALQVHHLLSARVKFYREDPRNQVTLCASCHSRVENRDAGYADWKLSTKGNLDDGRLEKFWGRYYRTKRILGSGLGGWRGVTSSPCPAGAEDGADIPIRVAPEAILPPLESETLSTPAMACQAFRAALLNLRHGFLDAARLADRIQAEESWRADGSESLEEFLADPAVGMERSRFFRLAQVGRLARLMSDASDFPALPERRWLRILPEVEGLEAGKVENPEVVQDLIQKAAVLTGADFDIIIDERRNAKRHPERPAAIPQDALGYDENGEIVATVKHVRVGETHHILQLAIPHEHAKIPMTITFR